MVLHIKMLDVSMPPQTNTIPNHPLHNTNPMRPPRHPMRHPLQRIPSLFPLRLYNNTVLIIHHVLARPLQEL